MIMIAISNNSTLVSASDLAAWLPALQTQLNRDLKAAWQTDDFALQVGAAQAGQYSVILKDQPDDPNDLGFHLLDDGTPEARIFCKPTLDDGDTISSVLSHELLEMAVDPQCTRMAEGGRYIIEVADPVETTGYLIDGVDVSNFVLPRYFEANETGLTSGFDFNGQLYGACPAMLPGGYLMEWTGSSWVSTFSRRADGSIPYHALRRGGRSAFRASKGTP